MKNVCKNNPNCMQIFLHFSGILNSSNQGVLRAYDYLWCLPECGEEGGVHPAGVPARTGQLRHQARLVWRAAVGVEVLDGGGEEGDPLLQLLAQRVLDQLPETQDHA